jgi:AcrR family transcriptional regulator
VKRDARLLPPQERPPTDRGNSRYRALAGKQMKKTNAKSRTTRPIRKRDAEATRRSILKAAEAQFALRGYDGSNLRLIAKNARADHALVARYFGSKLGLFEEAIRAALRDAVVPSEWPPRAEFGSWLAEGFASNWHAPQAKRATIHRHVLLILQGMTSPKTLPVVRRLIRSEWQVPMQEWLGGPHAGLRARFTMLFWLGVEADVHIRGAAEAPASRSAYVQFLSSVFQALFDGRAPE